METSTVARPPTLVGRSAGKELLRLAKYPSTTQSYNPLSELLKQYIGKDRECGLTCGLTSGMTFKNETTTLEAGVTLVIPWIRALPDRVALASFSTELGGVKTYL